MHPGHGEVEVYEPTNCFEVRSSVKACPLRRSADDRDQHGLAQRSGVGLTEDTE
jgi:hypothetical protein